MRRGRVGLGAVLALAVTATPGLASSASERGDAAWARRAEGQVDGKPLAEPIATAIADYEAARAEEPDRLDVHWKLLRAIWFSSEFVGADAATRRALLDRARPVSDAALALVAARAPDAGVGDAGRAWFWSAITLGAWSRQAGVVAALRAGIAWRLHEYAGRAVELGPTIDDGGPLRLLSRLHAEVPRIPLLTGWADRTQSLPLAERAYAVAPAHPGNRYVLGMALLEAGGARRDEGLALVEAAATMTPRPSHLIEDLAVRRDAAARLARLGP